MGAPPPALVYSCVRLFIFNHAHGKVTRKRDVREQVLGEWSKDVGALKDLLNQAADILQKVWAFQLVEVPKGVDTAGGTSAAGRGAMNASQAAAAVAAVQARAATSGAPVLGVNDNSGIFTLISSLPPAARRSIPQMPSDEEETGFLALLLVLIHLSKGKRLAGTELTTQLARLGLNPGQVHPIFGKWEAVVMRLVTARYLQRLPASAAGGEASVGGVQDGADRAAVDLNATQVTQLRQITDYTFAVGPRAAAEIDERTLMRIVGWVYGDLDVDKAIRKDLARRKLELTEGRGADLDMEARDRIEEDPIVDAFDEEAASWRALRKVRGLDVGDSGEQQAEQQQQQQQGGDEEEEEDEDEDDDARRPRQRRRRR